MVWQDFVITGTNLLFGFMLIPQILDTYRSKNPLNLYSTGLTFLGLMIVNITMASLGLWLSAIPICTIAWLVLFILSYKYRKLSKDISPMSIKRYKEYAKTK